VDLTGMFQRIQQLGARISGAPSKPAKIDLNVFSLDIRDEWGTLAQVAFEDLDDGSQSHWLDVLKYAATANGHKPSANWLRGARGPIGVLTETRFAELTAQWLGLLRGNRGNSQRTSASYVNDGGYDVPPTVVAGKNGDVLKGLAWCCTLVADQRIATALGEAAEASFKKIPNIGARSAKVGNACVYALGALPGTSGVAQLSRLEQRIKLPSARKMIETALQAAARRNGLERADLEELVVPTYGLVDGRVSRTVGGYVAEIAVSGARQVELSWRNAEGKPLRTEPTEVKRSFPNERKAIKRLADDIRSTVSTQGDRLESLFLAQGSWSVPIWRERYLDHPLVSVLARRLIWVFESEGQVELGGWLGGQLVDVQDRPLEALGTGTVVRLWHPIGWDPEVVRAWREWLDRHQITQPFKQAHREIYILTDAELATETYSNRFAAHILRQHQLTALCQQRGWRYRLQGMWDGANAPTLELPRWRLEVEFWCDGVHDPSHLSPSGVFLYLTSDQVRFRGIGRQAPVEIVEIPALVFSEVMRDVDLFVGVCSVGNDPTWGDRGPNPFHAYWQGYAFGDLSATAQTRQAILKTLLPRLTKIAARCSLTDKFLVVRGDRRTYKIHLGSANILMEPNDQYLCIVPRAGNEIGSDSLFLPFEGDTMLSIILSKAFLLANDRAIKDPTILRQIGNV
jgi:hypothetical protein